MKKLRLILFISLASLTGFAQSKKTLNQEVEIKNQIVEASCGECNFGLKGKSCDLAIRINNKSYFVDGTSIDKHGDAHAKDGFCEKIRQAEVTGKIVNGRFKATSFKLLPNSKVNPKD